MSSFGSLSVALSALQSHRRAMDVTGQNVANAGTAGYTRQRAELAALGPAAVYSLQGSVEKVGSGVQVARVVRLSDEFAASTWRSAEADSAFAATRAAGLHDLEALYAEPGENGLSAQLDELWASWSDLGDRPDDAAARGVVLQAAQTVVDRIAAGSRAVGDQWKNQRVQTEALATEINSLAASVADLNASIRGAQASGQPANELADQRDQLVVRLAGLTGGTARTRDDGTVDVLVSGTALVSGGRSVTMQVTGAHRVAESVSDPVGLSWPDGNPVVPGGGELAGRLEQLRTTLPNAAAGFDAVARNLASTVNALHTGGSTPSGGTAGAFFSVDTTTTSVGDAALSLRVAVTDTAQLAAAPAGGGARDGSLAQQIAALSGAAGGADATWTDQVVRLGVSAAAADRRATTAESTRSTAEAGWQSVVGVDIDEEMTNLISFQRAYEGAARVLTAVDEALDVLINRTGLVGR